MSDFRERAGDHFDTLSYQPKPMTEDDFWAMLERIRRPSLEETRQAIQGLSLLEILRLSRSFNKYTDQLESTIHEVSERGEVELPDADWWDSTQHVVFLGREVYEREVAEPALFVARAARGSEEGWGFLLEHREALTRATDEELNAALREGSAVRVIGDAAGLGDGELIEHPELGLGFIALDRSSPWMWLIFHSTTLSTKRHEHPSRSVTLYQEKAFHYLSIGEVRPGAFDLFECSGGIGAYRHELRVYDPRPKEEASAKLKALIESYKKEGFEEASPPTKRLVLQLSESGLEKKAGHHRQVLEAASRSLREGGLGRYLQKRVAREMAHLAFEVTDVDGAKRAIKACLSSVDGVGDAYSLHLLSDGAPIESVALALSPCEAHEDLAYFSKLSITPHPDTRAWAQQSAKEAIESWAIAHGDLRLDGSIESLSRLDLLSSLLQDRHKNGQLSHEERERYATQIGSYAGEILREALGGDWGVGTLFTERIWFGLLLGARRIKWWPVREASELLQGKSYGAFSERGASLLEKAKIPMEPGASRLYPLGANEGYFDAGVTRDGRQALMAAFFTGTFAFFFDQDGSLLEYATRPEISERPEGQPSYGPSRMTLETWQKELGFEPKLIRVHKFSSSENYVGIEDLPSHYAQFIEDPDSEKDPNERGELFASIQRWVENGEFVLYWGNDLWLNAEGHVTSS